MTFTINDIKQQLAKAPDESSLRQLIELYGNDERLGVRKAIAAAQNQMEKELVERQRLTRMYSYEEELKMQRNAVIVSGMDEVGRGPLAGPVAIGIVVLEPSKPFIDGLNDSKQVKEAKREEIAETVKRDALAWSVRYAQADEIDAHGISACLQRTFLNGISDIEDQLSRKGLTLELILLDGNPMHLDPREANIVKGDAKCASIAAASNLAKVERDRWMKELDAAYPEYGFAHNKGYGSAAHIEAIKKHGLCPIHRKTFCRSFV